MRTLGMLLTACLFIACGNASTTTKTNTKSDTTMTTQTMHLTKAEFLTKVANYETEKGEFKYLGDKPCIIDFYASWCGPCKMIAPILDELSVEYHNKIYIYKVDTEKEADLAAAFGIRSIPTLILVPTNGQPQLIQGAVPKNELKNAIDQILLETK